MSNTGHLNRRTLLKRSSMALAAATLIDPRTTHARPVEAAGRSTPDALTRLSLNENPYGPSAKVAEALQRELGRLDRYADAALATTLAEQVAAYERVPIEQVVLGEILGLLGLYLGSQGGPGGEFVYSTPGYLALVDAASHVGGVGIGVALNALGENDLPALASKVNPKTRAIYLVNPHNPTGTVSDDTAFKHFLREASATAVAIVDEAYLEYTPDFVTRSAVSIVREGGNVMVFRTFDKIHGLAGLPIGYVLAPRGLAEALRKEGAGDPESLGRLNIVAARAALADTAQVVETREVVARERAKWLAVLQQKKLRHTEARANFIFFDAGRPQQELADAMRLHGVDIGRAHPPYTNWARITIGLPEENQRARNALLAVLG